MVYQTSREEELPPFWYQAARGGHRPVLQQSGLTGCQPLCHPLGQRLRRVEESRGQGGPVLVGLERQAKPFEFNFVSN